jgi:hypothetical protein
MAAREHSTLLDQIRAAPKSLIGTGTEYTARNQVGRRIDVAQLSDELADARCDNSSVTGNTLNSGYKTALFESVDMLSFRLLLVLLRPAPAVACEGES